MIAVGYAAAAFRRTCIMALVLATAGTSVIAVAREDAPRRQTAALSQPVYQRLQAIQELVQQRDYAAAHTALEKLRASKLSSYERAQTWNLSAYSYYLQEDYRSAIAAYEQLLAQEDIPAALLHSSLKTLAQLYFTIEDYAKALTAVERLMAAVDSPSAEVYMLLGQTYFQLHRYKDALAPIRTAVDKLAAEGKTPPENWLLLLRAIHYELKDYPQMVAVLKELIRLYPKDQYLMTLAGVYSELGNTDKQLALTEALYEAGHLDAPQRIRNLVNLYLLHGVPFKAAKLLSSELDRGRLDASADNLSLLSQAWVQAREDARAVDPLARAAELSDTGELYIRLAQSYINLERWAAAAAAVRAGLAKGRVARPDTARIMLGTALFNAQRLDEARDVFAEVLADERSLKIAQQWLGYIDSEQRRRAALESLPVPAGGRRPAGDVDG